MVDRTPFRPPRAYGDLSRNGTLRHCSTACRHRVKSAAHRGRRPPGPHRTPSLGPTAASDGGASAQPAGGEERRGGGSRRSARPGALGPTAGRPGRRGPTPPRAPQVTHGPTPAHGRTTVLLY
ncbi:CGNR zinc finger domain-containing protein [Kitasatospora sp. NPDC089913]|uniref:CGNR zinc finger domain-containing protein n=1 Tax=Kitasatospora sp. NPDC089913 TaxID=3364080 RepID=UPI0038200AA5